MSKAIALLIAIEQLAHHEDDRMEHVLRIGVVGMPEPPLTVEIESDFFEWPRIKQVIAHGEFDLPVRLQDLVIFKLFETLCSELDGTDIAQWPISNATCWIETQVPYRRGGTAADGTAEACRAGLNDQLGQLLGIPKTSIPVQERNKR